MRDPARLFFTLQRLLTRPIRERTRIDGITTQQAETIALLEQRKELSVSEVAAATGADISTTSRNLANLEQAGFVERERERTKTNRRLMLVKLTHRGTKYAKHLNAYYFAETELLVNDSPEREAILRALESFATLHEKRDAERRRRAG